MEYVPQGILDLGFWVCQEKPPLQNSWSCRIEIGNKGDNWFTSLGLSKEVMRMAALLERIRSLTGAERFRDGTFLYK